MKPVDDWRRVLRKAWSVRFTVLAALLSGAEVAVQFMDAPTWMPRGLFAVLAGATSIAAFFARMVAQRSMKDGSD